MRFQNGKALVDIEIYGGYVTSRKPRSMLPLSYGMQYLDAMTLLDNPNEVQEQQVQLGAAPSIIRFEDTLMSGYVLEWNAGKNTAMSRLGISWFGRTPILRQDVTDFVVIQPNRHKGQLRQLFSRELNGARLPHPYAPAWTGGELLSIDCIIEGPDGMTVRILPINYGSPYSRCALSGAGYIPFEPPECVERRELVERRT
jgi:hypothetical protein